VRTAATTRGAHGVPRHVCRYRGYTHRTVRSEESAERAFPTIARALCADDLIYSLQGLELLVTVLLARNRQPPPTVAAGVQHAELAAELISLPSGLLVMVSEAIVKLKVRLWAAGVRARACGAKAMGEGRRDPGAGTALVKSIKAVLAARGGPAVR
jgi:hypothetical protein